MTGLLLVRHGNTFAPGEKVVWAGARTDLPLVEKGREQADTLGHRLKAAQFKPDRILAGPLLRTRQHTDIIASHIGFTGRVDIAEALREIDYGKWEGLSTEEIHHLGGKAELDAWDKDARWPQTPGWSPSPETILKNTHTLLTDLAEDSHTDKAMLITSNGILRFFAQHLANPPDQLKIRTGHYCMIEYWQGSWTQSGWNLSPDSLQSPNP